MLGSVMDGFEELDEFGFVLAAGVFLEGVSEGEKLDAAGLGNGGRVGGHEGEGAFGVVGVFGEVEADAADLVPFWGIFL